ncbi:hypothetical protein T12_2651, partial [Trichinella patagoniensis]
LKRTVGFQHKNQHITWANYLALVYLVTALVPSLTACLLSSPGKSKRTACAKRLDSAAMRSKMSLTKLFIIDIALLLIPVSGWTCFSTL